MGYIVTSDEKVRRVLDGVPTRTGEAQGGITKPDGTFDEMEFLAMYDKMGGGIKNANGDTVQNGSFYDYRLKKAKEKPEVMLVFRINGQEVVVPEKEEAPAIVKAARIVEQAAKDIVKKPKKK